MENLAFELPPPASQLLREWRKAAQQAHAAERRYLLHALGALQAGLATDCELESRARELRRLAEELRRRAFHESNFAAANGPFWGMNQSHGYVGPRAAMAGSPSRLQEDDCSAIFDPRTCGT